MLNFISINMMIGLQVFLAVVITTFWVTFLSSADKKDFSHMPDGYLLHEKSFVWPDAVIVILMLISAVLLYLGNPLGEHLALVAGGMTLFLGVIDIAYEYANEMYKAPRGSVGEFTSTVLIAVIAIIIIIRFL